MNAIRLLRAMHADVKTRLKIILGTADAARAQALWQELEPTLHLHEQLEDQFLYTPLLEELGPTSPLGEWEARHMAEVELAQDLIAVVNQLEAGTPEWRMAVGRVMDVLHKHVTNEEGQIFGRIEGLWDEPRLEQAGAQMVHMSTASQPAASTARTRHGQAAAASKE
jgi:hypothetical protein